MNMNSFRTHSELIQNCVNTHSTFNYEFRLACCESCDDDGDSSDHDSEIGSADTIHQAVSVGNNDHRFKFKLAAIAPVTRRWVCVRRSSFNFQVSTCHFRICGFVVVVVCETNIGHRLTVILHSCLQSSHGTAPPQTAIVLPLVPQDLPQAQYVFCRKCPSKAQARSCNLTKVL